MITSSDRQLLSFTAKAPSFKKKGFGPFYLFEESVGRLKCDPEAAPRPTFKWYKGGKELNTAPYSVQVDGTLIINNVNRARDAGEFSCFATNFVGNDTAKADATIYGRSKGHVIFILPIDS